MDGFNKQAGMDSWTKTMNAAMNDGGHMITLDTCNRSCALCKNPSNLQRCTQCFRVFYCSKGCQRADWTRHKALCQKVTTEASKGKGASAEKDSAQTCEKCKCDSADLKMCGRCGRAQYCSKDCQRSDWAAHKQHCKKSTKTKTESDWEAGKMFTDFARAMDPRLALPVRRSKSPALTWDQAHAEASRRHPKKDILTQLSALTCESDLDPVLMSSSVFLSRLAKPHPYVFRNAWYLEDISGEGVRIFFYLDTDKKPEPYFSWSQLDRGNFLCMEHAYIHTFMDGTTGIRVDDACDVCILGD